MQVRPVEIDAQPRAERYARRLGFAGEERRTVAQALVRQPVHLLLTEVESDLEAALKRLAPPPDDALAWPVVVLGRGAGTVLLSGSRASLAALSARAAEGQPGLRAGAEALRACLSRLASGPRRWCAGQTTFDVGARTLILGILNVTPDSFSDGGRYTDPARAQARAEAMLEAGADLIDVGGESTRPGAGAVSVEEERRRVVPVIERVVRLGGCVSVDTAKPEVARAAVDAGACVINDVTGLQDPAMARLAAETGCGLVVMHMRGTPRTMQAQTRYEDLYDEVVAGLSRSVERACAAGVARERIAVDPGIGFAKTAEQSLALLADLGQLKGLGQPILVGASRKSFIGAVTGAPVEARLPGSLAAAVLAARAGAHILRVHDVAETRQALDLADAIRRAGASGEAFDRGPTQRGGSDK